MRVRVYDKQGSNYFVSEVYAIVNTGYYEKYLVLEETDNKRYFRMFDYLDKSNNGPIYPVNINVISSNELPEPWVYKTEPDLKYFMDKLNTKDKYSSLYSFRGYSFIFQQKDLLITLFKGNIVTYDEMMGNKKQICTKLDGWNYVESEKDIENLMEIFSGFHDSVLRSLNYISGSRKVEEGMIVTDDIRQASTIFDSDWSDSIEIVFEGVLSLNLRPAKDNYTSDLFSATIMIKDETLLFYDDEVSSEQENYEGTWINALGMRWRLF
ncbi:hypothetical protein [Candidatus Clostridium radicumherbarum]|uniref:Uncharacterized protein n=1 Tax=Candidatus Clostridium radicumherbarum TaxID=3381662 RepID=A0ABW8TUE3_9CLOT